MAFLQSLESDLFGVALIVAAFVVLALLIRFLSALAAKRKKAPAEEETAEPAEEIRSDEAVYETAQYSHGELKLVNVDEKTVALIMAIVSHESGIPLAELRFKKIKLLNS